MWMMWVLSNSSYFVGVDMGFLLGAFCNMDRMTTNFDRGWEVAVSEDA